MRISNSKVEIDNCFGGEIENFVAKQTFDIKREPFLRKIYRKKTSEIKAVERMILLTHCDYAMPIKFIVIENGLEHQIVWNRIENCYPNKIKGLFSKLERTLREKDQ